ncbi:MAG: MazG nucleotide pyrophosphohydrolase domain-containing protein [Bacteroidia bacterium]|nr:MazG nucleotide pyrophosphohydrolase domain-containing protein [Bacteroidia bacterium]
MPEIPPTPTLTDLQVYQSAICKARGWDKTSDSDTFLLFMEEIGELAKAIRKRKNLYIEKKKAAVPSDLEGEFADVLSYLLELANRFEVNLEKAYRDKEAENAGRVWE